MKLTSFVFMFLFKGAMESSLIRREPAALSTRRSIWEGLKLAQESCVVLRQGIEFNTDGITSLNLATALSDRHLVRTFLSNDV